MIIGVLVNIGTVQFSLCSILWTIDQCWNILKPDYKSWEIGGLLAAANNQNIDYTGKKYTWGTGDDPTTGNPTTVEASKDADDRRGAIADKLNDKTNGVGGKLRDVWTTTLSRDWKKFWSTNPFNVPVIILTVVGGVLIFLLIIGLITTILINENRAFIIIGISFSVLTTISILAGILSSNGWNKVKLNEATIAYKYTGITAHNTKLKTETNWSTAQTATEVDDSTLGTGNDIHLKTATTTTAPRVEIKAGAGSGTDLKEEEIAELNIIALLDIDYTGNGAFGPNGRWYLENNEKRKDDHEWWHLICVFIILYYGPLINVGIYWIQIMRTFK